MSVIGRLSDLAAESISLTEEISSYERELKRLNERKREIEQQEMVDLMHEAGVDDFSHGGRRFSLKMWVGGVWPKAATKAEAATKYLEKLGADGIMKTVVSAQFGRDDHQRANEVYEQLTSVCDPRMNSSVHPQTLRAWARRRIEEGEDIDLDTLGLRVGNSVTVKEIK